MPGKIYGGRWKAIKTIGEGGQGQVFLVEDLEAPEGGQAVLKKLKNRERLGRFEQEISTLRTLDSDRIPKVLDYSLEDPYLVTEICPGVPLDKVHLQAVEAVDAFRDVVEAVVVAHEAGIVHRDIKPNNVMIADADAAGHRRAMLIDFGICQWTSDGGFETVVDEAFGNPEFAAPELARGSSVPSGKHSDVYMLGKLLYWMLTRSLIHRESFPDDVIQRIPNTNYVGRAHIEYLLKLTVLENASTRISARRLLDLVQHHGELIRLGINRVGARVQVCPTCRSGVMQPMNDNGVLPNTEVWTSQKVLRCEYCGYVQLHIVRGTESHSQGMWEF